VRKVNIDTDIRLAMTGALRRALATGRGELDVRKFLLEATAAARAICVERFVAFGCAGAAARLRPVPLDAMAQRYAA
jgi:fructose-bisphosphate aldolase class II